MTFQRGHRRRAERPLSRSLCLTAEITVEASLLLPVFWPLEDTGQGNLFMACSAVVICSSICFQAFQSLTKILISGSQWEMICLEIMCLLDRAGTDVMGALISWAGINSVTLTFTKVFENGSIFFILSTDGEWVPLLKWYVFPNFSWAIRDSHLGFNYSAAFSFHFSLHFLLTPHRDLKACICIVTVLWD